MVGQELTGKRRSALDTAFWLSHFLEEARREAVVEWPVIGGCEASCPDVCKLAATPPRVYSGPDVYCFGGSR